MSAGARVISRASTSSDCFAALSGFGCNVFFFLNPFLKAAFQNAPLSADLECRDLPMLDHAVQGSLGNFQYAGRFGQGEQLDRSIAFFHGHGTPEEITSQQAICQHPDRG